MKYTFILLIQPGDKMMADHGIIIWEEPFLVPELNWIFCLICLLIFFCLPIIKTVDLVNVGLYIKKKE